MSGNTSVKVDKATGLIELERLHDITAIGCIGGGPEVDVLAVSYGPDETHIRIRFDDVGERKVFQLPAGTSLEKAIDVMAEGLVENCLCTCKPEVRIYRGRQARKWVKRVVARAKKVGQQAVDSGDRSSLTKDGSVRIVAPD
tara:strand:+ start:13000 stop:13425 length:426 start_codon:yes stop_codon:yes gene_type:complete